MKIALSCQLLALRGTGASAAASDVFLRARSSELTAWFLRAKSYELTAAAGGENV
jgi:hypothetical protein